VATWKGSGTTSAPGSGNWTATTSWDTGVVPNSTENVIFPSGTYTVTINGLVNCANFTVTASSGLVTFLSSGANTLSVSGGSFTLTSFVAWNIPTNSLGINFLTAGGTINTAGVTLNSNLTFTGTTLTWTLASNVTIGPTRTVTLTSGTINLASYKLTCGFFSSSNSNARTIAFGASGNITVNGNGGTLWTTSTATSFTSSGSRNVTVDNNTGSATTIASGVPSANPDTNSLNFAFISGSYTLTLTFGAKNNISFTGFTGTVSNAAQTIYGDVILADAATFTGGANAWTLTASTAATIRSIDLANKTALGFPLIFNGLGSTFKFARATTLNTYTWTSGIFDLNGFVITATTLVSTGGSAVANGGRFEVTGNATTVVNLSAGASTDVPIRLTSTGSAGSRIISNFGTGGFSLEFSGAAADTVSFSGVATLRNLSTDNFGGTMNFGGNINTYGSLNFNSNTVTGTSTRTLTLYGSATQFNLSATTTFPSFTSIVINAAANYKLNADVTLSMQIALLGNAALDLNGKTLTAQFGYGLLSGGNTPTITMSSGTIKLTGDNAHTSSYTYVWDTTDNTTFVGSGTISCDSALPKYIGPAGRTLPTVEQAGVGTLTLADDGTGTGYALDDLTLKSTVTSATIIELQQLATTTFTNFTLSGTSTAQVTLRSGGSGVRATISKTSGTVSVSYLTIQDIAATGGATWNAFTSNGNVNNGNNTGWNFTGSTSVTVNVTGVEGVCSVGVGTVVANANAPPTGVEATGSVGDSTVAANANVSLTGVQATGSVGDVTVAAKANVSVAGVEASGAVGTVTVSLATPVSVNVTGVQATGSVGTADVAAKANVSLTGVQASGTVGSVTTQSSYNVTGVSASGAVGDVTVAISNPIQVNVTGVSASGAVGDVTVAAKANVSVAGVEASGAVGTVNPVVGYLVTGVSATVTLGNVTISAGARVSVTGVQATGYIGPALVWGVINDNQTPNWQTIDDSQSVTWSAINDAQTPNWAIVNDSQTVTWTQVNDGNTVTWVQIPT